jgi:hypothetical protein
MSGRTDSQDVGLEAATIERVRNSSLVEWPGADNVPGLKRGTEAQGSRKRSVGERSAGREAGRVTAGGACGSENVGMSSVIQVRNLDAVSLRVPTQGYSA